MCDQSCSDLRRNADHHPGKSGQSHSDLGSDRQGFTWFYRFALDNSGGANKHEVRAGPALFYDSSAVM
jgi:hypothetical protein